VEREGCLLVLNLVSSTLLKEKGKGKDEWEMMSQEGTGGGIVVKGTNCKCNPVYYGPNGEPCSVCPVKK
jgi:hypothetical protein